MYNDMGEKKNPLEDDGLTKTAPAVYSGIGSVNIENLEQIKKQLKSGASWFYWIAGLSLINTVLILRGSDMNFIIGLGITLIADFLAKEIGSLGIVIALIFDIVVAAIFVVFGYFAGKGNGWAFIVGMVFYTLDALVFLLAQDWLPFGFHLFALFCIYGGYKAHRSSLKKLKTQMVIVEKEV